MEKRTGYQGDGGCRMLHRIMQLKERYYLEQDSEKAMCHSSPQPESTRLLGRKRKRKDFVLLWLESCEQISKDPLVGFVIFLEV